MLDNIKIAPLEESLINRIILSWILTEELMVIYSTLKVSNNIEFTIYTNRSIDINIWNIYNNIVIDSKWILPHKDISFSCRICYHPSFMQLEILAILTVLIVISVNCKVMIFTDSQAAINGITNMMIQITSRIESYWN